VVQNVFDANVLENVKM